MPILVMIFTIIFQRNSFKIWNILFLIKIDYINDLSKRKNKLEVINCFINLKESIKPTEIYERVCKSRTKHSLLRKKFFFEDLKMIK